VHRTHSLLNQLSESYSRIVLLTDRGEWRLHDKMEVIIVGSKLAKRASGQSNGIETCYTLMNWTS